MPLGVWSGRHLFSVCLSTARSLTGCSILNRQCPPDVKGLPPCRRGWRDRTAWPVTPWLDRIDTRNTADNLSAVSAIR